MLFTNRGAEEDFPDLRYTRLPRNMQLVSKCHSSIIVRQLSSSLAIGRGECNAVVNIQDTSSAAGRPDRGCGFNKVVFGVDIAVYPLGTGDAGAGCALGKLVFRIRGRIKRGLTVCDAA